MKKLTSYLFVLSILFASCSKDENAQQNSVPLLKSYKIVKDAEGNYSINYVVNKNVSTDAVDNFENESKDLYLFSNKKNTSEVLSKEKLSVINNAVKVNFIEDNQKRKSIVVADAGSVSARGEEANYLVDYSIEDAGSNQYVLSFTVNAGVNVRFSYNETLGVNEVHLREGKSSGTVFSNTYTKTGDALKIDFVNHYLVLAKGEQARVERASYEIRRPRPIIQDIN